MRDLDQFDLSERFLSLGNLPTKIHDLPHSKLIGMDQASNTPLKENPWRSLNHHVVLVFISKPGIKHIHTLTDDRHWNTPRFPIKLT